MSRAAGRAGRTAGVLLAAAAAACASALFTAPPGTTITLSANPGFVASHGGRSRITAVLIEPAGTLVSDGTVVLFFTNLGTIDPQVKTRNGAAVANFVADSRSGTATITAISGGSAPAPVTSPSPGTGGGGSTSGDGSATTTIDIGSVNITSATQIRLGANPPRISISNSTHVTATVVDTRGNPLANIPVYFRTVPDPNCVGCEFFDGAGRPVFTNNNGEAEDVMRTRRPTVGQAQVVVDVPGAGGFLTSEPLTIDIL